MNEPKAYQAIMLSSTFTDLKEHRQRATKAIEKFGYRANVMEYDGARAGANVIESSLKMVRDSAGYICVISLKYGQTPFDPDRNPDRLSITELEFNETKRLGRPIVLFIMDEEHLVRKADIESDPGKLEKLNAFRARAKRMGDRSEVERVHEMFETLEQFSIAAAIAVGRLVHHLEQQGTLERRPAPQVAAKGAAPPKALSNIPITVPLHFLGRDEDLAAIDTALKGKRSRAAITTALHGLRGVGKTTLAAAYAEQHRDSYRATWWIRAETIPTMRADLVGLGVRLGWIDPNEKEEPALIAVLERLRDEGDGILLVYDNANNADEIGPYMQHIGATHIIVTSNAPNWSGIASAVEIEKWPKEIGADYLVAQAGRPSEREAALTLSEALDGLPLAHEQAAAYCARTGLPLAEYRKKFEAQPTKFLDTEKDASPGYHNRRTATKTFALAIDEAAKLHPAAEPLIVYAALLAPEPIPIYLFSEAAEQFGETFASAIAGNGLDDAIAALRAFALVDRESIPDERNLSVTTDCIRLHRLVRQVAAIQRDDEGKDNAKRALITALAAVYPEGVFNDPKTWPRARRLDVLASALVDGNATQLENSQNSMSYLLDRLATYRQGCLAAYDLARPLFERALAIRENVLGLDHPDTATSLNNLGVLLRVQGDFAGARAYFERALAVRENALGSEHLDTAGSLNNLGFLLHMQGAFEDARPYYERALAIREKAVGSDHPDTANSLNNLGGLLKQQGDLDGARPYYERALVIREKVHGSNHPDTANSLNNIGSLYKEQGNFAKALPYYERALEIRELALGSDHPDTAVSLNNLGALFYAQGNLARARLYVERALAIFEKVLGPEHSSTRTVAAGVIQILDELGQTNEAMSLRKKFGFE